MTKALSEKRTLLWFQITGPVALQLKCTSDFSRGSFQNQTWLWMPPSYIFPTFAACPVISLEDVRVYLVS